jgi:hypothetical protein
MEIITDNATEFTSNMFQDSLKNFNIEHHAGTQRNSTGNSPVERLHSTLTEIYRIITQTSGSTKTKLSETLTTELKQLSLTSVTKLAPYEIMNGYLEKPRLLDTIDRTTTLMCEYVQNQNTKFIKFLDIVTYAALSERIMTPSRSASVSENSDNGTPISTATSPVLFATNPKHFTYATILNMINGEFNYFQQTNQISFNVETLHMHINEAIILAKIGIVSKQILHPDELSHKGKI